MQATQTKVHTMGVKYGTTNTLRTTIEEVNTERRVVRKGSQRRVCGNSEIAFAVR